jgi:Flp pilus assembly protein TadG
MNLGTFLRGAIARISRLHQDRSGQVLVLGALALTVLVGASGVAIDAGVATVHRRSAQSAADAAALAGADDLTGWAAPPTPAQVATAISDATSYAGSNGFPSGATITVDVQSPPKYSSTHNGDVHSVEVTITENVPTFLLGVLNKNSIKVIGHSVATGFGSYMTNPTIALLDHSLPETLDVGITGWVNYPVNINVNGPLTVNSNDPSEAEQVHDNYFFKSYTNAVRGKIDQMSNGTIGPARQQLQNPIPDPLASIVEPSSANDPYWNTLGAGYKCAHGSFPNGTIGPVAGETCTGGSGTFLACDSAGPPQAICNVNHYNEIVNPGVWYNLLLTDDGTITMNPGTYIITGSLQLVDGPTGPGKITGAGVTFYFACPKTTAPYWQDCTPGTGNQNSTGPGGFLNLTGQLGAGIEPSVDTSPHILQGTYSLSAPTTGYYHGLLIFVDRQNYNPNFGSTEDHPTELQIEGNKNDSLSGTIYGQNTRGLFYTSTKGSPWTIDSCFVLDTLEIDGNADYNIGCSQANNWYGTAGTGSSTLVE